jgi:hypothetical protein
MAEADEVDPRFWPLRPASRKQRLTAVVIGPVMWVVALGVLALLVNRTDLIGLALLITGASFLLALLLLGIRLADRRREERRYADRR